MTSRALSVLLPLDEQRAALQVRRVRKLIERGEPRDDERLPSPLASSQRLGIARDEMILGNRDTNSVTSGPIPARGGSTARSSDGPPIHVAEPPEPPLLVQR